ncbi:alpha-glucosidase [Flavobacterium gawalongense]|uniref:Alpha-glucosidase n=2 Tax=Flavobacterium gawalongense TaxID=2594432 RepID=A0A553BXT2_9FLAO|nr:alpha-glucosidase [Flavobacterium gawalongense]TRX09431.1 alpha-glucosidase [Flavobacterium gawalongense]TRX12936.1 alpha-glucosidase [Flavobacterium gawalongense]TRX13280.1 alpha-glucosidase [Flavobacterium gawalongense]TRX30840.1 alpha-glucosidase [Flavobacterium gawalongense]
MLFVAESTIAQNKKTTIIKNADAKWWKQAVVYQIYPRSFKDSDGDGVGDLKGIISKLDYVKSLGIDAVWLNPIYTSPNDDNGYDISDYREIMKDFGTMEDFDLLLKEMHKRDIKLIMDLVVNHSSDEHEWFKQSRSSRDNKYRDYYHWWPAEKGKPPYRWSFFDVNSEAWKYDAQTNSYYLHYFSQKQPDLNWENPKVRYEVYDIMRFWLDKGIDGFRMDAFQFASKDTTWPELPKGYEKNIIKYYGVGPHLHDYLQEMNREVFSKYDIMTVAEGAGSSPEDALLFVDPDRKELNMAYHFESVDIGKHLNDFGLVKYKDIFSRYDQTFKDKGWLSIFLGNHDQPRMVSKFGNDTPEFRAISSKMLSTFIMTMRGTPYYYYGDELGMINIRFDSIEDYTDVDTRNKYIGLKNRGGDLQAFLEGQKQTSRENGRTPFQWDTAQNAGFTTGTPWLKVNPNYETINAEVQEKDPNSVLNYFRKLVQLRKKEPTLVYGKYTLLDNENPNVYAYTRELDGKKLLILLNFTDKNSTYNIGISTAKSKIILDNYTGIKKLENNILRPYEAIIIELKQ